MKKQLQNLNNNVFETSTTNLLMFFLNNFKKPINNREKKHFIYLFCISLILTFKPGIKLSMYKTMMGANCLHTTFFFAGTNKLS